MNQGSDHQVHHGPFTSGSFGVLAAAHELKAPVSLIRQLALELGDTALTASQKQLVERVVLTSERSLRLTEGLSKLARLDDSLLADAFPTEPVNPLLLCQEVARELAPLYQASNRTLTVRPRRTVPMVVAHRDLLRRILLGFADNALHYAHSNTAVTFTVRQVGGGVRISLRDQGPVLTRRMLRQAAAAAHVAGRPQGSGLGLVLAERFARAMNGHTGTICHRGIGGGMTFYVTMQPSVQLPLL